LKIRIFNTEGKKIRENSYVLGILFIAVGIFSGCTTLGPERVLMPTEATWTILVAELPDTWTPPPASAATATRTATEIPATETWTPTWTPEPSFTPTPQASFTPVQGENVPPTVDVSNLPDCTYTASETGVEILPAPFIDPYRILPTMEPGRAYPVVRENTTYGLIVDDGEPAGWVDYRLLAIDWKGKDCFYLPRDERNLTAFPRLCFFTPQSETRAYFDADLTEFSHVIRPPGSFVLLVESGEAYFSAYGHAGPSFYVAKDAVTTHGDCDGVPAIAEIISKTQLRGSPNGEDGQVLAALTAGQTVIALGAQPGGYGRLISSRINNCFQQFLVQSWQGRRKDYCFPCF